MGLFNRFKKNSHAEDFKKAYENNEMAKLTAVLLDWVDNGKHDAYFGLAMVILVATRRDKELADALAIFKSSVAEDHEDSGLFDWYKDTAKKLLDDWAGDELNKLPDLNKKTEEDKKVNLDEDYEILSCREFSAKFKELYDAIAEEDGSQMMKIMDNLNQLLEVWERKCPDDSHLPCAYVMVHAPELNQDDLSEYIFKHASGKVYDESLHEWYQDGLVMVIKFNETMNG